MKKNQTHRFTLIEIMTVMLIILVLVGASLLVIQPISKYRNDTKTKAVITAVGIALQQYHDAIGYFPMSLEPNYKNQQGDDWDSARTPTYTPFYLDEFYVNETDGPVAPNRNMNQFFSYDENRSVCQRDAASNRYYVLDAYQAPLVYRSPGKVNTASFDLISTGANTIAGDPDLEKFGTMAKARTSQIAFNYNTVAFDSDGNQRGYFARPNSSAMPYLGKGDDIANFNP